jgi:hypothetical protein
LQGVWKKGLPKDALLYQYKDIYARGKFFLAKKTEVVYISLMLTAIN